MPVITGNPMINGKNCLKSPKIRTIVTTLAVFSNPIYLSFLLSLMPWKSLKKILTILVFLLIWELLPISSIISKAFLAPPSEVFEALIKLLISGELWEHTSISLQRALTGFSLAAIIMIPLGFFDGMV